MDFVQDKKGYFKIQGDSSFKKIKILIVGLKQRNMYSNQILLIQKER